MVIVYLILFEFIFRHKAILDTAFKMVVEVVVEEAEVTIVVRIVVVAVVIVSLL